MHPASETPITHSTGPVMDDERPTLITTDCMTGSVAAGPSITIAEYVERRFIPGHVEQKTEAGRRHYQAILKHILTPERVQRIFAKLCGWQSCRLRSSPDWPYLDNILLCSLSSEHVRCLIHSASAKSYSPQTIKHIKNVVGAIMAFARNDGAISGNNPASTIKLQPIVHRSSHNITIQQAKSLVALLGGAEREIALLSLTTGMSAYEICKLQWKHVNLSAAPMMIAGEIVPPRCILVRREATSTDQSSAAFYRTKTIDIPDALFRRLLRMKRLKQHVSPEGFLLEVCDAVASSGVALSKTRLGRVGRELGMPWLSWQAVKRGHQALLAEMRDQLTYSLVASAR